MDGERALRHFFKILWQRNLKALEFRIIFHAPPAHRLLFSAHIDNYIHYSGAKSFVDNGRCESFLKSNET